MRLFRHGMPVPAIVRHRVNTTGRERMAACHAAKSQNGTAKEAVLQKGLDAVFATARYELTRSRQQWSNGELIQADREDRRIDGYRTRDAKRSSKPSMPQCLHQTGGALQDAARIRAKPAIPRGIV